MLRQKFAITNVSELITNGDGDVLYLVCRQTTQFLQLRELPLVFQTMGWGGFAIYHLFVTPDHLSSIYYFLVMYWITPFWIPMAWAHPDSPPWIPMAWATQILLWKWRVAWECGHLGNLRQSFWYDRLINTLFHNLSGFPMFLVSAVLLWTLCKCKHISFLFSIFSNT